MTTRTIRETRITIDRWRLGSWTLLLLRERHHDHDHDRDDDVVASGRAASEHEALGELLAAVVRDGRP
jgi:hypothetical protein